MSTNEPFAAFHGDLFASPTDLHQGFASGKARSWICNHSRRHFYVRQNCWDTRQSTTDTLRILVQWSLPSPYAEVLRSYVWRCECRHKDENLICLPTLHVWPPQDEFVAQELSTLSNLPAAERGKFPTFGDDHRLRHVALGQIRTRIRMLRTMWIITCQVSRPPVASTYLKCAAVRLRNHGCPTNLSSPPDCKASRQQDMSDGLLCLRSIWDALAHVAFIIRAGKHRSISCRASQLGRLWNFLAPVCRLPAAEQVARFCNLALLEPRMRSRPICM